MLLIKNLTKKFNKKKIVDNITLPIKRGEIAVLLGTSGVGKSTLLRIINNLETADSGTITLDDTPLNTSEKHQQRTTGMLFQDFNLFGHLTVKKNITVPLQVIRGIPKEEAENVANTLLTQYNIKEKENDPVFSLSGGQKQRLALARTLAMEPIIICLDEPTSALDPHLTRQVAQIIIELATQGYIVLIATHDTTLIKHLACSIYLMKHGAIIESASAQQFFSDPTEYPSINSFVQGI